MVSNTRRFVARLSVLTVCVVMLAGPQIAGQAPDTAADHYFVGFLGSVGPPDIALLNANGAAVRRSFPEVRAVEIVIANAARLAALARHPRVEYIEPVPMRYPLGLSTAQLTPAVNNGLYGLITTKSTDTHARGVVGVGVNVGVADTGLDYTHPDIAPTYVNGIDTVSDDPDPWWNNDANETHGTHVAGTVAAANNGSGVLGVAYGANLFHARVLGPSGGTTSNIMAGVRWLVVTAGCKVVNLSLGGSIGSRTEENFYKEMRNRGALVVAAAGNGSAKRLSYPAAYPVNIAVGAVDRNNTLASFSNIGKNLDVVAPGVGVLSSVPAGQGSEASVTTSSTHAAFGMTFAGATGGITGAVVDSGLGQAGEFPSGVAGNIALIQRGVITFADKVTNAMNAGAVAAIIYNNAAGEFSGTLGSSTTSDGRPWIPAVSVSGTTGATLVSQAGTPGTVVNQVSSWDHYDGTSMATPHVTGAIALIWSAQPTLSNATVEQYLFSTATDLGAAGYDTSYGRGLINASAAVALAGK